MNEYGQEEQGCSGDYGKGMYGKYKKGGSGEYGKGSFGPYGKGSTCETGKAACCHYGKGGFNEYGKSGSCEDAEGGPTEYGQSGGDDYAKGGVGGYGKSGCAGHSGAGKGSFGKCCKGSLTAYGKGENEKGSLSESAKGSRGEYGKGGGSEIGKGAIVEYSKGGQDKSAKGWRGDYGKGGYGMSGTDDFSKGGFYEYGEHEDGGYGKGGFSGFGKGAYGGKMKGGYGDYGKGGYCDYTKGGCNDYGKGWLSAYDSYGGYDGGYYGYPGDCYFGAYGGFYGKSYGKGYGAGYSPMKGWGGTEFYGMRGLGWGKGDMGKGKGGYGGWGDMSQQTFAINNVGDNSTEDANECMMQLRGLPFKATIEHVEHFLGPYASYLAGRNAIELLRNTEGQFIGRLSGVARVQFTSPETARAASEELNMSNIEDPAGGPDRYIEVSYISTEKQSLVNRVKELQKYSRENTRKWYAYCDKSGTQAYDPNKHDEEFIRGFLTAFEQEVVFEPAGGQSFEEEDDECTIQLRGVPFQATAEDVLVFLGGHAQSLHSPDSVKIVYNKDGPFRGRPSGSAKVKFSSMSVAKAARDDLNMKHIKDPGGGPDRYIEAFHNSGEHIELVRRVKELQKFSRENRDKWYAFCERRGSDIYDPSRHDDEFIRGFLTAFEQELDAVLSGGNIEEDDDGDECAVHLRGLPFRANFVDIKKFLGDHVHALHADDPIKIIYNQDGPFSGKPSGSARIKFTSPDAAKAARADLNMRNIPDPGGGPDRWVEVLLPGTKSEDIQPAETIVQYGHQDGSPVMGKGIDPQDPSFGEMEDEKTNLVQRVKDLQRRSHENRDKWYTYCERRGTSCHDPSRHDADFIRGFLAAFEQEESLEATNAVTGDMEEYDECTVQLRGLPFRATATDVMRFLGSHSSELQGDDSIKIVYNKDGQFAGRPSGVARVTFSSPGAVKAACSELNMKNIRDPAGGPDRWVEVLAPGTLSTDAAAPYGPTKKGSDSQRYDPYASGMDDEKNDLVQQVKDLQRGNRENRDKWYAYCEMRGTSCHDPSRHNAEFIKGFLKAFEEGSIDTPAVGGKMDQGGKGGKMWMCPGNMWY